MDKQRLLELAGITEAKYAGPDNIWIVVEFMDVGEVEAMGPFSSKRFADRFVKEVVQKHVLDFDSFRVVKLSSPSDGMGE